MALLISNKSSARQADMEAVACFWADVGHGYWGSSQS
jgi:hypothetical protein